ncbi:MAG TPA: hypothetical protein VKY73_06425 [Polyangiaceae bacterium]|nr:hypothetical protein [Polyangiaceae bacterium]
MSRPEPCPHQPPCPGCPRYGIPGVAPHAFERLRALATSAGLEPPRVVEGPRQGFRHRARLAVRGRSHGPKIGIFASGSHRVVHIPECRVHHPLVNEVAEVVRRAAVSCHVPPYSDTAHAGRLRYLQIVVERASASAQLVVVTNDTEPTGLEPFFERVARDLGPRLHSLFWNGNPERTNAVLGDRFVHLSGPQTVVERIGAARVHYPPGAFGQSNLPLADELGAHIDALVPDGAHLVELYAGVGALSLPLLHRLSRLDVNELTEHSLAGLARGIADLPPDLATRVHVHPGSAEHNAALVRGADVVLVDPPRRGLDADVLSALLEAPPRRLIYVSCGLDAFLREAEALLARGRLSLRSLEVFALFPYTEHVETLAVFERRADGGDASSASGCDETGAAL